MSSPNSKREIDCLRREEGVTDVSGEDHAKLKLYRNEYDYILVFNIVLEHCETSIRGTMCTWVPEIIDGRLFFDAV